MRFCIAQFNPILGDLKYNYESIKQAIYYAKGNKIDLIIFPELALVGYPPCDLLYNQDFIKKNRKYLKRIAELTKGIGVILGFVEKDNKGKIYNSASFIFNKKIFGIHRKVILSNYHYFQENTYFSSGNGFNLFKFKDLHFALTIGEEISDSSCINILKKKKPHFIINISALPYQLGSLDLRVNIFRSISKNFNTNIINVNLVGGEDSLVFDGRSMVIVKEDVVLMGKEFLSENLIFDSKIKYKKVKIKEDRIDSIYKALCLGLHDYMAKNNFKKAILGVSGGIDSAVVLALAVNTLGKDNVVGLIMPSLYTSTQTLNDAKLICDNLNIEYHIISIEQIVNKYFDTLESPLSFSNDVSITQENIQSRVRANILMAFSNRYNYLVLNTGNKSELLCGYCTIYGDTIGGFSVLKDIYKTDVYRLAHFINEYVYKKEVIPKSVIDRIPTAELKPNQKDSDVLPLYEVLDKILEYYVDKRLSYNQIIKKGFSPDLVKKVVCMVEKSEYKRRQTPPGAIITPYVRNMPLTHKFYRF